MNPVLIGGAALAALALLSQSGRQPPRPPRPPEAGGGASPEPDQPVRYQPLAGQGDAGLIQGSKVNPPTTAAERAEILKLWEAAPWPDDAPAIQRQAYIDRGARAIRQGDLYAAAGEGLFLFINNRVHATGKADVKQSAANWQRWAVNNGLGAFPILQAESARISREERKQAASAWIKGIGTFVGKMFEFVPGVGPVIADGIEAVTDISSGLVGGDQKAVGNGIDTAAGLFDQLGNQLGKK